MNINLPDTLPKIISERGARALTSGVKQLYAAGQTDYYLDPIILEDQSGNPVGRIKDGDAVVFCCRRGEREIQLTEAFTDLTLDKFPREKFNHLPFVILTLYHEKFKDLPVAFAPSRVNNTLGEIVSNAGLKQARISESEKFAHVTFFFNGGNNKAYAGEEDIRIPSPKNMPFDQIPELALPLVSDHVIRQIKNQTDLIVTNFANGDVIGHTSNREAKIKCAEVIDQHLKKVFEAALEANYVILITADHGNLEELLTEEGSPHVSHTTNPVPFLIIDPQSENRIKPEYGKLSDVAPTLLHILGVDQPSAMDGKRLTPAHHFGEKRKALLIILDGWGISHNPENDPILIAETPFWDQLLEDYPHAELLAAGDAVGLKSGKAGNSEAGHMNLGAGRIVLQDDVRLNMAMKDGSFFNNEVICQTISDVKERGTNLHLIGLLTEKSSHGSMDYPIAVLKMAQSAGLDNVFLHMIFDGRSTEPGSAPALLELLESKMDETGIGQIVSGIGRGIALDRDGNYDRTRRTYDAFVYGTGKRVR